MDIFGEIFENFGIDFCALCSGQSGPSGPSGHKSYIKGGEKDFCHSCIGCHRRNISGLGCFETFLDLVRKKNKEGFGPTRLVGLTATKKFGGTLVSCKH